VDTYVLGVGGSERESFGREERYFYNEQRIGRLITSLFSRKNAIGPIPIVSSCPRRVSMCQDDIRPNASHCSTYPFNTDKQFSLLESTKRETERDRRGYIKRRRRNNI